MSASGERKFHCPGCHGWFNSCWLKRHDCTAEWRPRTRPVRPIPVGHMRCQAHPERLVMARHGYGRCYLCEAKDNSLQRIDWLIRIGLGELPQSRITQEAIRMHLRRAPAIETTVAVEMGWVA